MKFLLDHDVPDRIADVLAQADHTVLRLREVLPIQSTDDIVLAFATTEKLILITCNRDDFLRLARTSSHSGIIILIRRRSRIAECAELLSLIEKSGENGLSGNVNFA